MSPTLGRPIVREYLGLASEHELFPIDHVFDGRSGPVSRFDREAPETFARTYGEPHVDPSPVMR